MERNFAHGSCLVLSIQEKELFTFVVARQVLVHILQNTQTGTQPSTYHENKDRKTSDAFAERKRLYGREGIIILPITWYNNDK